MKFTLDTVSITGIGTFGVLLDGDGNEIAKSVEREWKNNEPNVSCIPAGEYDLVWRDSPKYGRRLHLEQPSLGVSAFGTDINPLRSFCLFHPANWPNQLNGCIALGDDWMESWGVANSRKTTEMFEEMCLDSSSTIEIIGIYPIVVIWVSSCNI